MGTDTSALEHHARHRRTPGGKVMRIATMTTRLLDELHSRPLDTAALDQLRIIDTHIVDELLTDLTQDLRQELQRLALPLTGHTELSDTELRLAHAQLVGWLQGLLQTAQTALADPHAAEANNSTIQTATGTSTSGDVPTAPSQPDRPPVHRHSPTACLPADIDPESEHEAIRSARRTLITAITRRITQQRLTAAQAATVLHLTGPRATQLLHENIDAFTLDELVSLLPALELTVQVVPIGRHGR